MSSTAIRPPDLPRPAAFAKQNPNTSKTKRNSSSGSARRASVSSMASEASRDNLRSVMHQRESFMTRQEYNFVSHLLTDGSDVELTLATKKLQDDDLFAGPPTTPMPTSPYRVGPVPSREDLYPDDDVAAAAPPCKPSSFTSRTSSIGSEKREDRLRLRRQCHRSMYGPMWKAHENGIAVSERSSRQSFLEKQSVANPPKVLMKPSLGRRKTIASIHHFPIFRSELKAPITRHGSFLASADQCIPENPSQEVTLTKGSSSSVCEGKEPTLEPVVMNNNHHHPKGVLRRMQSAPIEAKSVTFHDLPPPLTVPKFSPQRQVSGLGDDDEEEDVAATTAPPPSIPSGVPLLGAAGVSGNSSIPSLHHGRPLNSYSIGSILSTSTIPSIHPASHVRSNSIGSYPSLHHGHPIRRESSFASLHHGRPIRQASITSVPSLRHGNPVRANSISTQFASLELDMSGSGDQVAPEVFQEQYRAEMNVIQVFNEEKSDKQPNNNNSRPVLMRQTTSNTYQEGVEVTPHDGQDNREFFSENNPIDWDALSRREAIDIARKYGSLVTDADGSENFPPTLITCVTSFDETMSEDHRDNYRGVFRGEAQQIYRSISDDDLSTFLVNYNKPTMYYEGTSVRPVEPYSEMDGSSWEMESEMDGDNENSNHFDAWIALKDEYVNGYGGGGSLPFLILGTSADDVDCHPHVLSPPLMESLQSFFPFSLTSDNFWIKYSVVRDGASLHTLLQQARGAQHSILAIETVDGEVFGSFTTQAWRKNWSYFGGGEAFLWRMRNSRTNQNNVHSILDQAKLESEVDIFPYTGVNPCIQFCTSDKIAVGGGSPENTKFANDPTSPIKEHEWGHGLTLKRDLMHGCSSPCVTFGSPSLSSKHSDGSVFEIMNLELWTLTPCRTVQDAEKLELGKFFLQQDYQ